MKLSEIKKAVKVFKNAIAIRVIDNNTKHIIDEWPIESSHMRKVYKKNEYIITYILKKDDRYFMYANGKLKSEDEVGFNIPKNTDIAIEYIDENSNVLFTNYQYEYYDDAGTLGINRKIIVRFTV